MKKIFGIVFAFVLLLGFASTVRAQEYVENVPKDSHKVMNKWDLSGDFVAHAGYNWKGMAEGATWNYGVHIKQAMNQEYSVGLIHFWTGDIDVVGQVKETRSEYNWATLAAFGTADYNDHLYYFMFFYDERAVWFVLSDTPYDAYLASEAVYPGGQRAYQLHSKVPDEIFNIYYKSIHEL